jgi:Holliday junction resolvasome RuvABC endonuclease subunit
MKIMGVDPSITCTGVSLPDGETMALKPPGRVTGDDRLRYIADHLHVAAVGCRAELVVMEGLFGTYQGEAARVIPMLHGAIRLELLRLGVPYVVLHPSTLKKFATGDGGASKSLMATAALKRLGRTYSTDDECDADWCRVAGRMVYGLTEYGHGYGEAGGRLLTMPQAQLQALVATGTGKQRKPVPWPEVGGRKPWPKVGLRASA